MSEPSPQQLEPPQGPAGAPSPPPPAPPASPVSAASPASAPAALPLPLPSRLCVPLPPNGAELVLAPGTPVAPGQPLMTSTAGAAHVPLAPMRGVVRGLTHVQLLGGGGAAPAVEIDVDTASPQPPPSDAQAPDNVPLPTDPATLIERLRACGVRASRSASPDLLAQLHEAVRRPIDTVLCSLMDAAGGSALSAVVMRTMGREILAGLEAIGRATGASRLWLVADSNIIHRASALVRKSAGASRIKVVELENDYPQADPTLMLYALFGRRLRPGRLPPEVNTILLDGAAAGAVGRAVTRNEPMLDVPIEVRDAVHSRSTVYTAAVGLPVKLLIEAAGLRAGDLTLRAGAALRDVRVGCDAVVDGGGELSIDAGPLAPLINPDPCIRCGWCVESCPVRIHPAGLLEAAQDNDPDLAERYGLHACIECGICSYVCPSRLPLLPAIRQLRSARGNGD
jgi:Na+-translocating ferredoxin:NAD+ oxidoreductase subunit C